MRRADRVDHEFVEFIPDELAEAKVYISIPYTTCVHLCLCGCGHRVVTPLSPTDWRLTFNGETIALDPSIGNWSFDCQSHYWIKEGRVAWARRWSRERIDANRAGDRQAKQRYFSENENTHSEGEPREAALEANKPGWLRRLRRRLVD